MRVILIFSLTLDKKANKLISQNVGLWMYTECENKVLSDKYKVNKLKTSSQISVDFC